MSDRSWASTGQRSGFDVRYPGSRILEKRTSNPKLHWNQSFASGPLIPTFANVSATMGCERWNRTTSVRRETAMIKVSVMYPNKPGARFDHDYYRDKHMPLVKARLGEACTSYTVDKGLAGGAPGAPATYVGMCHIFCDSIETFQAGFGPHAKEIMADIANYTDQAPVIQISEVVVGR